MGGKKFPKKEVKKGGGLYEVGKEKRQRAVCVEEWSNKLVTAKLEKMDSV